MNFRLVFCLSAEGLAVGLGIGTIAEVAKQSLGGKQKEGLQMLSSLLLVLSSSFPPSLLKPASAPFQLSPGCQSVYMWDSFDKLLLSVCFYIKSAFLQRC